MSESLPPLRERIQSMLRRETETSGCRCQPSFDEETLVVDATSCPHDGILEQHTECRATVIEALKRQDVDRVLTESDGVERAYEGGAAALLVAAGRFAETVEFHDERLAERSCRDPLAAAREATGRADVVATIAAKTGLAELAQRDGGYETLLAPFAGPTLSHWRVETTPPPEATLTAAIDLETGGTARRYEQNGGPSQYYLYPVEHRLGSRELAILSQAYRRLASGEFEGGERAPARAVRSVVEELSPPEPDTQHWAETVTQVLSKHARGYGLLADLFADPSVTDVFVTAPASANRLRVAVEGETLLSNIRLTDAGVEALSSRFRRQSGRAFSRADPTLDATADISGRQVRIAGVTDPTSNGSAFAFRAQGRDVWTLPALVRNDTLSPPAAALLSLAVERGSAALIAGPRSAGKTTLLGALLWELPPTVRTVVIEDTPELPVSSLQGAGRDVQALLASDESTELSPSAALRTALRLGDGALAVGEVRGEEACVLYEAMRVGANSEAVLGTIHGDGGTAVFERVVSDLGVSPSSFGVTDLIITLESTAGGTRRVKRIEELLDTPEPTFETLYEQTESGLTSTGRIERGNSHFTNTLRSPTESYEDVRNRLTRRRRLLSTLSERDATSGEAVTQSHTDRFR